MTPKPPASERLILVLPRGKLNRRNRMLHAWAMANGVMIEFTGGEGEEYRGAELTEPVYFDECPDDFPN